MNRANGSRFPAIPSIVAINWHMGGFDIRAHGYGLQEAWGKYPLAVMAHIADLEATWLDETGVKK